MILGPQSLISSISTSFLTGVPQTTQVSQHPLSLFYHTHLINIKKLIFLSVNKEILLHLGLYRFSVSYLLCRRKSGTIRTLTYSSGPISSKVFYGNKTVYSITVNVIKNPNYFVVNIY